MIQVEYYKNNMGMATAEYKCGIMEACEDVQKELPSIGYDYAIVSEGEHWMIVTPDSIEEDEQC